MQTNDSLREAEVYGLLQLISSMEVEERRVWRNGFEQVKQTRCHTIPGECLDGYLLAGVHRKLRGDKSSRNACIHFFSKVLQIAFSSVEYPIASVWGSMLVMA